MMLLVAGGGTADLMTYPYLSTITGPPLSPLRPAVGMERGAGTFVPVFFSISASRFSITRSRALMSGSSSSSTGLCICSFSS